MSNNKKKPVVIELKKLTKQYGVGDARHNALDSINLTVEKGEFIAIMGPSGCGKTTLLNILGLLDRANDGEYFLDGRDVAGLSGRKQANIRSEQIGIVFQNFNLIDRMNVIDNVALPLTYRGVSSVKRLEKASEVLRSFHLQEREYYMPWQLSGGQLQRVAIARALVSSPSLILADEPTGNLDSKSSHVIMEELADLHRRGNTIIMVTHNPSLTSYASRVIRMLDGTIASDKKVKVQDVSSDEVFKPVVRRKASKARKVSTDKDTEGAVDDKKHAAAEKKAPTASQLHSNKEKPKKTRSSKKSTKSSGKKKSKKQEATS